MSTPGSATESEGLDLDQILVCNTKTGNNGRVFHIPGEDEPTRPICQAYQKAQYFLKDTAVYPGGIEQWGRLCTECKRELTISPETESGETQIGYSNGYYRHDQWVLAIARPVNRLLGRPSEVVVWHEDGQLRVAAEPPADAIVHRTPTYRPLEERECRVTTAKPTGMVVPVDVARGLEVSEGDSVTWHHVEEDIVGKLSRGEPA